MRTARTALTVLLFAGVFAAGAVAQPPAPALVQPALNAAFVSIGVHGRIGAVGVDFFYNNLAPYGYWVDRPSYGWVWVPRHIRHHWRPYSNGRWVWTDYGWTWVSYEPYGWATYHYGRWHCDADYGWEWVPGTDWGPGWVSWRQGGDYVGWAALPPEVGWSAGGGLATGGFDLNAGIDPGSYCFVPERHFLAANVATFIDPPARNLTIINNTSNFTNFRTENGRVFNQGVPVQQIAQVTGQPVRPFRLDVMNTGGPRPERVSGNTVAMFRPAAVVQRANAPDPTRVVPRAVATGRIAQQLVQERRPMAAQFRLANAQQQGGGRTAQGIAARQMQQQIQGGRQAGAAGRLQQQQQAQGGRQGIAAGRVQPQQLQGGRQATATGRLQQQQLQGGRQAAAPTGRLQSQQGLGRRQTATATSAGRFQQQEVPARRQAAPAGRNPQQQLQGGRQLAPPPQFQRQAVAPRNQPQPQVRRQAPPPQQQPAQVRRQSTPPPQQFQRQAAPPPQRQAAPQPQREAPIQRQAPPPPRQMAAPPQRQAPPPPQRQAAPPPQRQAGQAPPPQQRRQPPPGGTG